MSLSEVALAAAGRVPGGSRCEGGTWTGRGRLGVKLRALAGTWERLQGADSARHPGTQQDGGQGHGHSLSRPAPTPSSATKASK